MNPFCPFSTAWIRITAFSLLGRFLLLLQTLLFLVVSGGMALVAGGALVFRHDR
ncbi:hypothetical protein KQ310_07700 [Synechococcus sp. CS-1328]|nr:hypothetical protein [Synechococcus sp. CS-1328]